MRVLSFIESSYWAMRPAEFDRLLHVATRNAEALERINALNNEKNFSALLAKPGESLSATRYVTMRDSIAVIDLNGTISKRMNLFTELCDGGTSTEILMQDFKTALFDPKVSSIVFNIDSPGGEAFGINELAQAVYKARGRKPIKAYVSGLGCSGAYWIASAADEIILDGSAFVGSIGVVSVWMDDRNFYKSLGIDKKVITSSNAPKKRLDLNNETDLAEFQGELDAIESVFIDAVIRNRSINRTKFKENFNQGGILCGGAAVNAGMADRTGSLEQVISELTQNKSNQTKQNASQAALEGEINMSFMDKMKQFVGLADELKPLLEADQTKAAEDHSVEQIEAAKAGLEPILLNDETKVLGDNGAFLAMQQRAERAEAERGKIETEKAAWLEEKRSQQTQQIETKVKAFCHSEKRAGRLTPAEEKEFSAAYLQALTDDAAMPVATGQSRAQLFETAQQKRPAHLYGREMLAPGQTAQILLGEDETESERMTREARNQVKTYYSVTNPKPERRTQEHKGDN